MTIQLPSSAHRCAGALYGLFIGDALAMPVHWYYDTFSLQAHYGTVTDYLAPTGPHPDSILWRSRYQPTGLRGDILHDQARYWGGERGVHYHQFLRAGENTLNVQLANELLDMLAERGGYDPDEWLGRYIAFMTTPGRHRDTYVEEYHRHFFARYAVGADPRRCAVPEEKHIGGLATVLPLLACLGSGPGKDRAKALYTAQEHMGLTHGGARMRHALDVLGNLLLDALEGRPLREAILARVKKQDNPLLGHPFEKLLEQPDTKVVGRVFSTACYVEESVPAVIYLALKYHDRPEAALIANTNLGGDNASRGAALGALLGAANGLAAWPERWVTGLLTPPRIGCCPDSVGPDSAGNAAGQP